MSPGRAMQEKDFADLESWNTNIVRLQLLYNAWTNDRFADTDLVAFDRWLDGRLVEIRRVAELAHDHGIGLVIDLHTPPGGRAPDETNRIFLERRYQQAWFQAWIRIAQTCRGLPGIAAYDLVNEPSQHSPPSEAGVMDLWTAQAEAARLVRSVDSVRPIFVSTEGGSPFAFAFLPRVDVPGVRYTFHMYEPGWYVAQGQNPDDRDTVAYPGVRKSAPFDKAYLRKVLAQAREFQAATGAKIYVGEFSAVRWAPGAARYLADCISLFEESGWDWSYHAFREYQGWDLEMADLPRGSGSRPVPSPEQTDRLRVVRGAMAANQRFPR